MEAVVGQWHPPLLLPMQAFKFSAALPLLRSLVLPPHTISPAVKTSATPVASYSSAHSGQLSNRGRMMKGGRKEVLSLGARGACS